MKQNRRKHTPSFKAMVAVARGQMPEAQLEKGIQVEDSSRGEVSG